MICQSAPDYDERFGAYATEPLGQLGAKFLYHLTHLEYG